jgi:hypothetical protein
MRAKRRCDEWSEISFEKGEWRIQCWAYNYAEHLRARRRMMGAWADYLDQLREAARVGTLKRKADRTSPASRA